jgi:very-short-patch-repair endonuclease
MMRGLSGCGVCNGRKLVKGKNDFATKYPQLVMYFKNKEDAENNTYGSAKKVTMICPICGNERLLPINQLARLGFSCPKCGDGISYPNKFMYCLLKQLNVDFEREVVFDWSENKRYDFVVGNNIIEMDGSFHLGSKYFSYKEVKEIDNLKDKMAFEHGYNMIRIPCYESDFIYIKRNIENSELNNIFELNKVDWVALEKEITDINFVKIACDAFNKYKGKIRIKDISKNTNIPITTLCKLLKIGARIGLTDYDENISISGGYTPSRYKQKGNREVVCIETGQIFSTGAEASRYFGKYKDYVSYLINKNKPSDLGYHFKYIKQHE